jgi:hypothetical protein
METYEQQVVRHLRDFFDDGNHPYVKNVQLEGTTITIMFYDKHIGMNRDEDFDIYDEGLNTSGHDYPEPVASMIGTHVDEEALAARKQV